MVECVEMSAICCCYCDASPSSPFRDNADNISTQSFAEYTTSNECVALLSNSYDLISAPVARPDNWLTNPLRVFHGDYHYISNVCGHAITVWWRNFFFF